MRIYGGYTSDSYLTYAVDGFFRNGGKLCFIGRIVRGTAAESTLTIDTVNFKAVGEGEWGNRVGIRIDNAGNDPNNNVKPDGEKLFKLTLAYWKKEKISP